MPGKRLFPSGFCFIPKNLKKSAGGRREKPLWTGWNKNKSAALPLRRPPRLVFGRNRFQKKRIASILLTLPDTLILLWRFREVCAFWTAEWGCLTAWPEWNRNQKQSGTRPLNLMYPEFVL